MVIEAMDISLKQAKILKGDFHNISITDNFVAACCGFTHYRKRRK